MINNFLLPKQERQKLKIIREKALFNFKYKEAIYFYENLLKKYQLSAKDLCDLGLFYDHLSIFDKSEAENKAKNERKAIKCYKKAEEINPRELAVFEGLGRIWWHRKNKKALFFYMKGLRLAQTLRKKSEFLEYLGNAYMRLGKVERAIEDYKKSLRLKPISKFSLFNNLAFAYRKINNQEKAREYARKALQLLKRRSREYKKTKATRIFAKQLQEIIDGPSN